MFKSFLNGLAKVLLSVAKGAAKGAVYVASHPELIQIGESVALAAGANPAKVAKIDQGVQISSAIVGAVKKDSSGS